MPVIWEIDPTSENASNVPLVITTGNYRLLEMEAPPATINPMYATSADTEGDRFVDSRYQNRTITLTLLAKGTTDALTQTAVNDVQQKIEKLRRDGGTLKFTTLAGTSVVADVNFAKMTPEFTKELYLLNKAVKFTLEFDCAPFFRGTPTQLADHVETTAGALVFTETGIAGDVTALGSLVIDDDQAAPSDQLTVVVGWRSKNYSSASSAALYWLGTSLTALSGAVATGGSIQKTGIYNQWIAMVSTQATGGGAQMTHTGTYRVLARVFNTVAANESQVALEWGVGDLVNTTRNEPVTIAANPTTTNITLADLGLIYIRPGVTSWQGRILARSTSATVSATVNVQALFFIPVDEGSGTASASVIPAPAFAPTIFDAFQNLTNSAVLNARTGTSGSTWTTGGSTAGDFFQSTANNTVGRFAVGPDTTARFATYGSSITGAVDVTSTVTIFDARYTEAGIFARWTNSTTHIRLTVRNHYATHSTTKRDQLGMTSLVSGSVSQERVITIPESTNPQVMRLVVDTVGNAVGVLSDVSGNVIAVLRFFDSNLATGGTLANGQVGLWDYNATTDVTDTDYTGIFASNAASFDAAMFPSKSLTLTHNAVTRTERSTSNQAPINYEGDYLRVPQGGKENRTVQFIVKGSRGVLNSSMPGDSSTDDISARLTVTPRYLVLPS